MAVLSTGPIENSSITTERLLVKLVNRDTVNYAVITVEGYYLTEERTRFVHEQFVILPNTVMTNEYFISFDSYEFVFITSGLAETNTDISIWGLNGNGEIVSSQRIVSDEELKS